MTQTNALPLQSSIILSVLVHVVILLGITVQMKRDMALKEPQVMRVQLVSAPQSTKTPTPSVKKSAPKPKNIKTQASAAPPKPVKKIIQQEPSKAPTKMVDLKKAEPNPIEKIIKEAKKRPPVLDRTPQKKKVIKSEDPDAKTVQTPPDDFMAALDAIDDLKLDAPKDKTEQPIDADVSENIELSHSDQNLIGKIKEHIEENWVRPPGLRVEELSAVVEIRLTEDGMVEDMKVTQSSGQTFYDNSIKRAVRKAQPLPIPVGKYAIFKVLELYFKG